MAYYNYFYFIYSSIRNYKLKGVYRVSNTLIIIIVYHICKWYHSIHEYCKI